jgi:DNA primase
VAGRIPSTFVDDLLARVDIVDVVDHRVPLRKQGSDWVARCPFHDENTPSFTVTPSKQLYYCFGCGAGGSALGFVMAYDNLGFVEAVETLAQSLGMAVPRDGGGAAQGPTLEPLYEALACAERFYRRQLSHSDAAVEYLKRRGISGQTAARFGLGFAPAEWRALLDRAACADAETLHRAGLVNQQESSGRYYDRLRERVVFPIRDRRGRAIAFGGRVLGEAKPKYLNTPESPVFHKGRELYGLYEARRRHRQLSRLVVVEGYMDVVGLAEQGIDYAVATLGTAASRAHVERLLGVVNEVVFCFDGDAAGQQAAWRALGNTLPALADGREARFLFLPEGEDPDSLVATEGAAAFEQRLAQAHALADYLIQGVREGVDTSTIGGRVRIAERARPLLASMPQGLYHELLIDRLAATVGTSADRLRHELTDTAANSEPARAPAPTPGHRSGSVRMTPMRTAIAIVLQHPELAQAVPAEHPALSAPLKGAALLADVRSKALQDAAATPARLVESYRETAEHPYLERLATHEFATVDHVERAQALQRELEGALARLREQAERARRNELIEAAAQRELTQPEKAELRSLTHD